MLKLEKPRVKGSYTAGSIRGLVAAALFCALLAAASQLVIPLQPVPINLALLVVFLLALVLPPRLALLSVGVYLLMGAVGLPVFAGFKGGSSALFGPTGGYLLGYFLCAAVISMLREKAQALPGRILLCVLGLVACYLPGTLWLSYLTGRSFVDSLALAVFPFLVGDSLKVLAAAVLAPRLIVAVSAIHRRPSAG